MTPEEYKDMPWIIRAFVVQGRCKSRKDGKEVVRRCQDSEEQESQKIWC